MDEDGGFPVCKLSDNFVLDPNISGLERLKCSGGQPCWPRMVSPPGPAIHIPYMEHMGKTYGSYIYSL